MMRTLTSFILLLAMIVGCTAYPRYGVEKANTPQQPNRTVEGKRTDDFLQFGLIVEKYLGKPYAGHSRYEPGYDCSLFVQEVMQEYADVSLPRSAAEQYREGLEVSRSRLEFGDLVFFTTERDKISHVGIYTGYNEFIHASTSQGVIISALNEKYWSQRYVGARRILQ